MVFDEVCAKYCGRAYDQKKYNCWDFANTVWGELNGTPLEYQTPSACNPGCALKEILAALPEFKKIDPLRPAVCLLLCRNRYGSPHIGVYKPSRFSPFKKGSVLHVARDGVATLETLETFRSDYVNIEFYIPKESV